MAYGLCIRSEYSNEECELTSGEVKQFQEKVKATASNDTSRARPPLSNPFRAREYAEKGEHYSGSEGFANLF